MSCCAAVPGTTSVFISPVFGACCPVNLQEARCLPQPSNPLTPYDAGLEPQPQYPYVPWDPNNAPASLIPRPPDYAIGLYQRYGIPQLQ